MSARRRPNGRLDAGNAYNPVTRAARELAVDALVEALRHTVDASLAQTWTPEATLRAVEAADDEVRAVAHALRVVLQHLAVNEPPRGNSFYPPVVSVVDQLYRDRRIIEPTRPARTLYAAIADEAVTGDDWRTR